MSTKPNLSIYEGSDPYLVRERVAATCKDGIDPDLEAFNFDRVSARVLGSSDLMTRVQTPPMMADLRALVVDDASSLSADGVKTLAAALTDMGTRGIQDVRIILVYDDGKKPPKALQKLARVHEKLEPPKPWQTDRWLIDRIRARGGCTIEPAAAAHLAECIGPNPGALDREVDKILSSGITRITAVHAESATGKRVGRGLYALADGILERKTRQAREILAELLADSDWPPPRIIVSLTYYFLEAGQLAAAREAKTADPSMPPWKIKNLTRMLRGWRAEELRQILLRLGELDRAMRTTGRIEAMLGSFVVDPCEPIPGDLKERRHYAMR